MKFPYTQCTSHTIDDCPCHSRRWRNGAHDYGSESEVEVTALTQHHIVQSFVNRTKATTLPEIVTVGIDFVFTYQCLERLLDRPMSIGSVAVNVIRRSCKPD